MMDTAAIRKITSTASGLTTRVSSISAPLWKLLVSGADKITPPQKSLCISLEKASVSVAYGSVFLSKVRIKGIRRYPVEHEGYASPEELASTVFSAVNELDAAKAGITLSLPKEWVVIKKAELPVTVRGNLQDVVAYELDRLTPFNSENAFYDYRILEEDKEKLALLLVSARADSVNRYTAALREKGIHVSRVNFNMSGIGSLCRRMDGSGDAVFVEINDGSYEGALFSDGFPVHVFAGNFPEDSEESRTDMIMSEITPLIESARREGRPLQLLASFREGNPSFVETLRQKANLPVRLLDESVLNLDIPHPPCSAVGGVLEALLQKEEALNLLKKGGHGKQRTPMGLTIVLLLIIAALAVFQTVAPVWTEKKRLAKIESEIASRKKDVSRHERLNREIKEVSRRISYITEFKEDRPTTLNILRELTAVLPGNSWLKRISITETAVEIEGYADSATGLLSKLESSNYFRNVKLASSLDRSTGRNADRFKIRMDIEGAKDMATIRKGMEAETADEDI